MDVQRCLTGVCGKENRSGMLMHHSVQMSDSGMIESVRA
jgi:hypothetical protein